LSHAQLRQHATDSITEAGKIDDSDALEHLLSQLRYVSGDYNNSDTLTHSNSPWQREISGVLSGNTPVMFATVINGLGEAALVAKARLIVEKPFGETWLLRANLTV
jgi:glucose-6-phosphate 1-dehydrogenase